MATRIDALYEQDFYVWTQRQAEALRSLAETRPNIELDFPHLIEEVATRSSMPGPSSTTSSARRCAAISTTSCRVAGT